MITKIVHARADIALLITRLLIGGIFISAGWMKITTMGETVAMFSAMHIPAFLTYMVAYGEFIGGILLVLGVWTTCVSVYLGIIMIVAIWLTYKMGPSVVNLAIATLAGLVALFGVGAGDLKVKKWWR